MISIDKLSKLYAAGRISRRDFMQGATAMGVTIAAASTMAVQAEASTPKKGGTLRVALGHGSTTDSYDPATFENGFANGTFSVVNDGSVYQPWKNDFEPEGEQELSEAWNEKVSIKGLKEFRAMYKTFQNSGIDKRFIQTMEKLYDDMVIGGMYSSRSAEEKGILKIDGRTKYKNANW